MDRFSEGDSSAFSEKLLVPFIRLCVLGAPWAPRTPVVVDMLQFLIKLALRRWPAKVFTHASATAPYMVRYYLLGGPDHLRPNAWFRLYLNNIRRSDDDTDMHNHPWPWAVSLILKGGYWEERLHAEPRRLHPGAVNIISGRTFHRVALTREVAARGGSWSLFLVPGKSTQPWGFLNRRTLRFRPAKSARVRGAAT